MKKKKLVTKKLRNKGGDGNKEKAHRNKPIHIPMKFEEAVNFLMNAKIKK